ncbi:hypothetical protein GCM10009038_23240 [Salinicola rhizosphaerae]|uniref:Uncharacterized protein n=2 Tax=Salinicola rhizosphaerae TaxID=1443141 RepID=A0ABQ3E2C4_9GAMM|nr:hypothetical protein GCM10009038_23240 [Salinicola rhizosphaerae]
MIHEALRLGHIIIFHREDVAAISQDASFYQSDLAKQIAQPLLLGAFRAERERFESRATRFGHVFRREEIAMTDSEFVDRLRCFLAPMLPRGARTADARRYCAERSFARPWFLIERGELVRVD